MILYINSSMHKMIQNDINIKKMIYIEKNMILWENKMIFLYKKWYLNGNKNDNQNDTNAS